MTKKSGCVGRLLLVALSVAWASFCDAIAARGTPLCFRKMRFASQQDVIRQGTWTFMERVRAERAAQRNDSISWDSGTPIDIAEVDTFLRQHPDCCKIRRLRTPHWFPLSRTLDQSLNPHLTFVEVDARPRSRIEYFDSYKVNACWDNVTGR